MISSKKGLLGSEFVLWFFRFLVIILLVVSITFMVYAVKRQNYDVRDSETVLISKNIMDCITNDNKILAARIDNFKDCINANENEIYIRLSVFDSMRELKKVEFGRKELKVFCDMLEKVKQEYPPLCNEQRYLINFYDNHEQIAYLNLTIALANENA